MKHSSDKEEEEVVRWRGGCTVQMDFCSRKVGIPPGECGPLSRRGSRCYFSHIFPSLPHQNPSESLMQKNTDCAGAGGHTLAAPLHPSNPWRRWRPGGLNLRRRAVKTGHLDPTSLIRPTCGERERRKAEPPPQNPASSHHHHHHL